MENRPGNSHIDLPINLDDLKLAAAAIGGKWKTAVLYCLAKQPLRFAALQRAVGGISEKVLTQQLRELELSRLIDRHVTPSNPPQVEYAMSEHGRSLCELVHQLSIWGDYHRRWLAAAPRAAAETDAAGRPPAGTRGHGTR